MFISSARACWVFPFFSSLVTVFPTLSGPVKNRREENREPKKISAASSSGSSTLLDGWLLWFQHTPSNYTLSDCSAFCLLVTPPQCG